MVELVAFNLRAEGHEVITASNGLEALNLARSALPDLIVLDLMMPEMDGFEFVDQVRLHPEWRLIPIVVVTALNLSAAERHRLNGYVETILHKASNSREALLAQVRDLVVTCASRSKSDVAHRASKQHA